MKIASNVLICTYVRVLCRVGGGGVGGDAGGDGGGGGG